VDFAALLAFASILLAAFAIARPVQRRSLGLFVSAWPLIIAFLISLSLLICRDAPFGVKPPFGWSLSVVQFSLTLGAFLVLIAAAVWCWITWHRGKLTDRNIGRVEGVFTAALREREFDEVERIVRKNQRGLERLPSDAASVLFNRAMVASLVDAHPLLHLELLSEIRFLKSLENRSAAVDAVVRELLRSSVSPLRSAVVSRYGGLEHLKYTEAESRLMEATFQNPEWYLEARAHYPLVISAVGALRTGAYDAVYNSIGRDYEARQGTSARSNCPVYLAAKTEVLAIEAAIRKRSGADFYVSDLCDIFRSVLERSQFKNDVWENPLGNREFPTPYAYLLYEITADLRHLSERAVGEAMCDATPPTVEPPSRIAQDLAQCWSFCLWVIADSVGRVSPDFRRDIIKQYLLFILELGWQPSEISFRLAHVADGLQTWRDLFLGELRARFRGDRVERVNALRGAMGSLDQGKRHVSEGYSWLEASLTETI